MAELKTKATSASAAEFLESIPEQDRRKDCQTVAKIMQQATGSKPVMWGPSIVGFGSYHYRYPSGQEGDWFRVGFSPRKSDLTLYLIGGLHLLPADDAEIRRIARALRDRWQVEWVAPAHCTGEPAFAILKEIFADRYLFAGLGATLVSPGRALSSSPADSRTSPAAGGHDRKAGELTGG